MGWHRGEPKAWNQIGPWTRGKRLGIGGFGSVYIGIRDSDQKHFAVKSVYFVPRSRSEPADSRQAQMELLDEQLSLSSLINEIRTLKKLRSPYIIRYIGCGTSKGPKEMDHRLLLDCYIEYLPRGSLWNIVKHSPGKRLKEPFLQAYTKDILRGLVYLHFNNLVHGDIKCQNILMGSENCKVADFGSMKDVRTSFISKILIGTPDYLAPEVEARSEQTYASDIFSLGCTVVEMATGKAPKPREKDKQLNVDHYANRVIPDHLSSHCKNFLSKCFAADPRSRWTASNLLNHPFLTQPLNPNYRPYHMPLDEKTEKKLLIFPPQKLIIPPDDLDSALPRTPFSPIHVMPMKRRKTSMSCMNVDETDVAIPQFIAARASEAYPGPVREQHSTTLGQQEGIESCPPPYEPELYPRGPDGNYITPTEEERRIRVEKGRAALAAVPLILAQRSEVASSFYEGHRVDFPAVARLDGDDEDKSPLVVQICSEFGIPLPPEYQKWILDPDFKPDAVANPRFPARGPNIRRFLRAIVRFIIT